MTNSPPRNGSGEQTRQKPSPSRPLTPKQKAKVEELEEIARLTHVDFWNFQSYDDDNDVRNIVLGLAKDRLVRSDIVYSYVLIDELLCKLIARHFFDPSKSSMQLWKNPSLPISTTTFSKVCH